MVSLADAKQYLGVDGDDEDAIIGRLISTATAYLARIGVTVDPEPEPVSEAVLLILSQLYRRTKSDFAVRQDQVEGVGTSTNFDPQLIDDANWKVVRVLIDPYREGI